MFIVVELLSVSTAETPPIPKPNARINNNKQMVSLLCLKFINLFNKSCFLMYTPPR